MCACMYVYMYLCNACMHVCGGCMHMCMHLCAEMWCDPCVCLFQCVMYLRICNAILLACSFVCMCVRNYLCDLCTCVCMRVMVVTYTCMHACLHVCIHVSISNSCVELCMYVCTRAWMHLCVHVFTYACMIACTYARMHLGIEVCVQWSVSCMYVMWCDAWCDPMHACKDWRMYVSYVCMHACMYVRR